MKAAVSWIAGLLVVAGCAALVIGLGAWSEALTFDGSWTMVLSNDEVLQIGDGGSVMSGFDSLGFVQESFASPGFWAQRLVDLGLLGLAAAVVATIALLLVRAWRRESAL